MILQVSTIFDWFPRSLAWLLIMVGLVAITWMGVEQKRQGGFVRTRKEGWQRDVDVSRVLRVLSYTGIIIGAIAVWAAFVSLFGQIAPSYAYEAAHGTGANYFTVIALIVVGLVCILKPFADLPMASFIGMILGIVLAALSLAYLPVANIAAAFSTSTTWVDVIFVLAIGTIIALLVRFWMNGIMAIAKVLSFPLVALAVAIFCFVQGIMLLVWGSSLVLW